jgi:predicted AAA+ superfamily ATPase
LLKTIYEKFPNLNIICTGSLLGLSNVPMPVGKVDTIKMFPLTFDEFLENVNPGIYNAINQETKKGSFNIPLAFTERVKPLFLTYLTIGGMPEIVNSYIENKDLELCDRKINTILELYNSDFNQYNEKIDPKKIRNVYQNIPSQLAKEKPKFIFSNISKNGRISEYEDPIL